MLSSSQSGWILIFNEPYYQCVGLLLCAETLACPRVVTGTVWARIPSLKLSFDATSAACKHAKALSAAASYEQAHSFRLGKPDAKGLVELCNDGAIGDGLARFVLVDDRLLLVDGSGKLCLRHLLGHPRLLQGYLEVVRDCLMATSLGLLIQFLRIRAHCMCRLVGACCKLLVGLHCCALAAGCIHTRLRPCVLALRSIPRPKDLFPILGALQRRTTGHAWQDCVSAKANSGQAGRETLLFELLEPNGCFNSSWKIVGLSQI